MKLFDSPKISQLIVIGFGSLLSISFIMIIIDAISFGNIKSQFHNYSESSEYTRSIFDLELRVLELNRRILVFRVANDAAIISDVSDELKNLELKVKHLLSVKGANEYDRTTLYQRLKHSLQQISENVSGLETQWLKLKSLKQDFNALFDKANNQTELISKELNIISIQPDELKNIFSIQAELYKSQALASIYFGKHDNQSKEEFAKLIMSISKKLSEWQINQQKNEVSQLLETANMINKTFYKVLQADRSFIFLVNVVIAGESAELKMLSEQLKSISLEEQNQLLADTETGIKSNQLMSLMGSIILLLFALLISRYLFIAITKPLSQISNTFKKLTTGEVITTIPGIKRTDEIGQLSRAADVFMQTTVKAKELQRDLELSNHELEIALKNSLQASIAKSQFVSNMSHEIRTPMNAVLGMLQLLQKTELTSNQQDYLSKASSAAKILLQLLNDILDFSKIEAGKIRLDPKPFDLHNLLSDIAIITGGNLHHKNIEVLFDIDSNLPSILEGDDLRLQQILINLTGNAIKFTDSGNVTLSMKQVSIADDQIVIEFAVADTGIGISPEQSKRIFTSFEQAEATTTRRYGGTGLGLVICKSLINLMGSQLHLESELGKGSRFWFQLTFQKINVNTLRDAMAHISSQLHILIVDDNETSKQILASTLASLGWTTDQASSGYEAIEKIIHADQIDQPYQLVLMDWRMPDLDGVASAEKINALDLIHERSLIIMVTAYARDELIQKNLGSQAPFKALLSKPVTPLDLVNTIYQTLNLVSPSHNQVDIKSQTKNRLKNLSILLVEDNDFNRQIAQELLEGEGAIVDLAFDGLEAVRKVFDNQNHYDIVIMDIQMPNMDGLEATSKIRADNRFKDLPILAMTANASAADRDLCLAAGMNSHIGKPIELNLLISEILVLSNSKTKLDLINSFDELQTPLMIDINTDDIDSFDVILGRCNGDRALLEKIYTIYIPNMNDLLKSLADAMQNSDVELFLVTLHTMKGMASTMGAKSLSKMAVDLEQKLKASNTINSIDENSLQKLNSLNQSSNNLFDQMFENT